MPPSSEDPVVRASRREASFAIATWLVAMLYTVTYCYTNGYGRAPDTITFVLWFPDWVFWGIIVPWLVCIVVSAVFAFGMMGNEPLGEEVDAEGPLAVDGDEVAHG